MDTGKGIAFMAGQERPLWDFEDISDYWTRANSKNIFPIIAVPTTAGTGSETGRAGVFTNEETKEKKIIFHPKMMPSIVILDPNLTIALPPNLTAFTGMDVLAHCLEAYCSPFFHPLSQGIALEGISIVKKYLVKAFNNPNDLESRANMIVGSAMGSTAFQKGLGAIHSLSHPVGAIYNTHHGLTNAVFMPYVLIKNKNDIEECLFSSDQHGLKSIFPKLNMRSSGCAALDLAYVGSGRLDGYFHNNINLWDIAAGILIVKEAGGSVTDFEGKENYLNSGRIVASNFSIHDEMLRNINTKF